MTCPDCKSYILCAADCGLAPWNQDRTTATPFVYLLRQRRWAATPVPRESIFFAYNRVPGYRYGYNGRYQ